MRTHVSSVRNAHVARRSEHMQGHADAGAREALRGREADAGASHSMLWRARRSEHMQGHADAGAREARLAPGARKPRPRGEARRAHLTRPRRGNE